MKGSAQFQGQHWQLQQRWDFNKLAVAKVLEVKWKRFQKKLNNSVPRCNQTICREIYGTLFCKQ